jgi:hypothetical protein
LTAVAEVKPLRLSWSRLRVHDECPAKGDLQRRHKSPITDIRSFFHGNVVDLLMRRWLAQEDPEPGWMSAQVDAAFEESAEIARESKDGIVRWKTPTDKAETLQFCRDLVAKLEPILQVYCLPFDWAPAVRFEVPITIPYLDGTMREIILVGEIDLLVFDRLGRVAVWDLKATRDNSYWRKVAGQLAFYAIACRASKSPQLGRWPARTGLIQPMCDQQVLQVDITEEAKRQMSARIVRTARDIWAGNLAPKESNDGCGWCQVRHACPKFAAPAGSGRVRIGG